MGQVGKERSRLGVCRTQRSVPLAPGGADKGTDPGGLAKPNTEKTRLKDARHRKVRGREQAASPPSGRAGPEGILEPDPRGFLTPSVP